MIQVRSRIHNQFLLELHKPHKVSYIGYWELVRAIEVEVYYRLMLPIREVSKK